MIDLHDAIAGFQELERRRNQEYLEGVRFTCFYTLRAAGAKVKLLDVFELDQDIEARKQRIKRLKPIQKIEVKADGK